MVKLAQIFVKKKKKKEKKNIWQVCFVLFFRCARMLTSKSCKNNINRKNGPVFSLFIFSGHSLLTILYFYKFVQRHLFFSVHNSQQ